MFNYWLACRGNELKVTFSGAAHWSLNIGGCTFKCDSVIPVLHARQSVWNIDYVVLLNKNADLNIYMGWIDEREL